MSSLQFSTSERRQIRAFHAQKIKVSPRVLRDIVSHPCFSLAKTPRHQPIIYCNGQTQLRVEPLSACGIATIWDADILIWAATKIALLQNAGKPCSRHLTGSIHEILSFSNRDASKTSYQRLRAALTRLAATHVTTSIWRDASDKEASFCWIEDWRENIDQNGRAHGLDVTLTETLFSAIENKKKLLTIDRGYFDLTGGLERWLYGLVRRHGGHQYSGWDFEFRYLYQKSACLSSFHRFSVYLRALVTRQAVPGYRLSILLDSRGAEILAFRSATCGQHAKSNRAILHRDHGLSCTRLSDDLAQKHISRSCKKSAPAALNLYSNLKSNLNCADVAQDALKSTDPDAATRQAVNQRTQAASSGLVLGARSNDRDLSAPLIQQEKHFGKGDAV